MGALITDDEIKIIMARAKADNAAWAACPQHEFDPPAKFQWGARYPCLRCGVSKNLVTIGQYIAGFKAAGGDPDVIWPGWTSPRSPA